MNTQPHEKPDKKEWKRTTNQKAHPNNHYEFAKTIIITGNAHMRNLIKCYECWESKWKRKRKSKDETGPNELQEFSSVAHVH